MQEQSLEYFREELRRLKAREKIEKLDAADPDLMAVDPDALTEIELNAFREYLAYLRGGSNLTNLEATIEKTEQAIPPGMSVLGNSRLSLYAYIKKQIAKQK